MLSVKFLVVALPLITRLPVPVPAVVRPASVWIWAFNLKTPLVLVVPSPNVSTVVWGSALSMFSRTSWPFLTVVLPL